MTILEPCCKHWQFLRFLQSLKSGQEESFVYYGDVSVPDWLTDIILEMKGADLYCRLRELDLSTLNYLLNRMHDRAFVPGRVLTMLNKVTIAAYSFPETLPQRANILIEEGRLVLMPMKRKVKYEVMELTPCQDNYLKSKINSLLSQCWMRLTGNFFADNPTTQRNVTVKLYEHHRKQSIKEGADQA